MTIDEAIAQVRAKAIEQSSIATESSLAGTDASKYIKCKQEHEQLVEWLEELKVYQQHKIICNKGYNAGYNKAIDDFTGEIKDWQIDIQDNEYDAEKFDFVFERIYEMAEELKAGGENERSI